MSQPSSLGRKRRATLDPMRRGWCARLLGFTLLGMEQMIQALLGAQWGEWKAKLANHLAIDETKAGGILSGAAQQVMGLFTGGKLDLASLQSVQGVSALLEKLDLNSLAQPAGIDPGHLEGGLRHVLPDLVQKASGLFGGSGLSSLLGNLSSDLR